MQSVETNESLVNRKIHYNLDNKEFAALQEEDHRLGIISSMINELSLNLQQLDLNLNTTPQNENIHKKIKNTNIILQQASSMSLLTNKWQYYYY